MLRRSARFVMAVVLALSLCPLAAYADNGEKSSGSGNIFTDLLYMVVGYEDAESDELSSQADVGSLYQNALTAPVASTAITDLALATDFVNGGQLVGAAGNLYYLREAVFQPEEGEKVFAYHTFERFNVATGTWTTLESLPSWLECVSATMFDQKIIVLGIKMGYADGVPTTAETAQEVAYSYDPKDEFPSWVELPSANVPAGAGIVNNGGVLEVVGGLSGDAAATGINVYEPHEGIGDSIGQLASGAICPKIVPHDGDLYVYSCGTSLSDWRSGAGTPRLQIVKGGSGSDLSSGLPVLESYTAELGFPSQRSALYGGISSGVDGVVIAGPEGQGGTADTFTMDWDDSTFASYDLKAGSSRLFGATACVYLGKLYTLGSYLGEDKKPVITFRSTGFKDAALLSGNNSVWRENSKEALKFVFSPDYGRFSTKVNVDGTELTLSADYDSSTGSTVILLKPEYVAKLSKGSHELVAFFDDALTQVPATFSVETAASSIEEGYSKPTALASTSDELPIVPIVVCALIALVVAGVAIRKGMDKKS